MLDEKEQRLLDGSLPVKKTAINGLLFFKKKHSGKYDPDKFKKNRLWPSLIQYCEHFFNNIYIKEHFSTVKSMLDKVGDNQRFQSSSMDSYRKILVRVERLEDFYKMNKEAQKNGAQDKRYWLFVKLRSDCLILIDYLNWQTKPPCIVSLDKYKEIEFFYMD